ncbi:MAG: hypothetical protein QM695_00290 [Micropruina sp.]
MKHVPTLTLLAAVTLVGCSAPSPAATPSPSPSQSTPSAQGTPSATPTPTATEPEVSERGHIVKEIGEWAGMRDGNGDVAARFRVTKIDPNFRCTSGYSEKPQNGHYVGVWMEIKTTAAIDFGGGDGAAPYFNTTDWEATNSAGVTENDAEGNGYSCARESDALPSQLGPRKSAKGVVVLDIKTEKGYLALVQDYMDYGWEWKLPSK